MLIQCFLSSRYNKFGQSWFFLFSYVVNAYEKIVDEEKHTQKRKPDE